MVHAAGVHAQARRVPVFPALTDPGARVPQPHLDSRCESVARAEYCGDVTKYDGALCCVMSRTLLSVTVKQGRRFQRLVTSRGGSGEPV